MKNKEILKRLNLLVTIKDGVCDGGDPSCDLECPKCEKALSEIKKLLKEKP